MAEHLALNALVGGVAAFLAVKAFDTFNKRLDEALRALQENTVAIAELRAELKYLSERLEK